MKKASTTKRRVAAILMAFVMVAALGAFGFAPAYAYEAFDESTPITLTARFTGAASNVSGIALRAYKVADMDSDAKFTVDSTFSGYSINFNGIQDQSEWRTISSTLSAYIERDAIAPDYTATTANGVADFGEVEAGLYLIAGPEAYTVGTTTYSVGTAMVTAPQLEGEAWVNAAAFAPKYTSETIPDNPPPPDEPPPEVPETAGLRVIKVWDDGATDAVTVPDVRPQFVEIELVCDGEVIDTVILNAANGWQHDWVVDPHKTYTVTEKNVPTGYTVAIVKEGSAISVTNTYIPPETPPDEPPPDVPDTPGEPPTPTPPPSTPPTPDVPPRLPQTGVPWIPAIILGCTGLLFVVAGGLRRRSAANVA